MALARTVRDAFSEDRGGGVLLALLAAVAVFGPVLNLLVPESSAVSRVDVCADAHRQVHVLRDPGAGCRSDLGVYGGILSLGHAAFFALGGYAMGMYLMRQIGTRGVYGHPVLPDFMVFLNWDTLPWFWLGFDRFWFALVMVALVPGLLAFVFGWLAFRSRVTGVYLSIMTQALSYALMLAFFRNDMGFGGNNGFTDFKDILGLQSAAERHARDPARRDRGGAGRELLRVSRDRPLARRPRDAGDSRRREPHAVSRLSRRVLQALGLRVLGGARRHCRRALRAAGRHHQPERVRADQLDRSGDLGRRRRQRHALRGRGGSGAGQLREDLFHGRAAGGLALRARRHLRARHAVPSARADRTASRRARGRDETRGRLVPTAIETGDAGAWRDMREAAARRAPPLLLGKILYLEKLTVSFDGFKALDALTLYVDPGELRCIIGPNGAGKTTMMDVITGKTRPDEGSAWFGQNVNLLALSEPEIAQAGIGRKFQKPSVFEFLSVFENLELALAGDKSFWRDAGGAPDLGAARPYRRECSTLIGLVPHRHAVAGTLSHGQKQWLEIGMLLMQDPELLLVDEPVAGMTPRETERTAELLLSLAGKHSVIVVEHDMEFVRSIASLVTVLHEGRVLAEGNMEVVQNDPRVIEVYLGT